MVKELRFTLAAIILAPLFTGCAVYSDKRVSDTYANDMHRATKDQVFQQRDATSLAAKRDAQTVDKPFIAGKARPLAREVSLPAPLRGSVDTVMLYKNDADLSTIAARIQQATGIMVKVTPDALLPLEAFRPRLAEAKAGGVEAGAAPSTASLDNPTALLPPIPEGGIRIDGPGLANSTAMPMLIKPLIANGSQPLPAVLDSVALRLGVYWKYDPSIGALVFYRTETRAFEVRNAEIIAGSEMGVDLSGGVDNKTTSGIKSQSQSFLAISKDEKGPLDAIVGRVKQFMTQSGQVAFGNGGLIVVTDTKTALDQIEKYLELENKMRSRRVELVFEEITIEKSQSAQAGMNWNLMFQSQGRSNTVDVTGLNSLLEQEGAALALGVSVGTGQWAGSSIAMQALSKVGKVVDVKLNTFGSNNGQPATIGRPERQKYISELEQTKSYSDSSAPTVSVTQEEEVSGRILTVVPYAYSNGDINLAIKFDSTPTPEFTKQVLPDGSYVQSPHSITDVLVRTAMVRSGQPFVISAYSQNSTAYAERRVDRNATILFGGSDLADQSDRVTVQVLTAVVRE